MAKAHTPDPTWSLTLEELDRDPAALGLPADVRRIIQRETDLGRSTRARHGRVVLVPGIMGSRLRNREGLIWLDLRDLLSEGLTQLQVHPEDGIEADGVLAVPYFCTQWRLRRHGWEVHTFPYDWRQSLEILGQRLAQYLDDLSDDKVNLVCHSMGGLVARAAMNHRGFAKVERVVQLAPPNRGSFDVVLSFLGKERRLGLLDFFNLDVDKIGVAEVLKSFAGLTQMLPFRPRTPDYLSPVWWDGLSGAWWKGERPLTVELERAAKLQRSLPVPNDKFTIIAGDGEATVADVFDDGSLQIRTGRGDGTVSLDSAVVPGVRTYYADAKHMLFASYRAVIDATDDILRTGETTRLRSEPSPDLRGVSARQALGPGVPFRRMTQADLDNPEFIADMFREFIAPVTLADTRRRRRRLEIQLVPGSLTDVATRAWVVGLFSHVEAGGAARAVDACLDGALSDITSRRMVSTTPGSLFLLPTGRHPVFADVVALCGLGGFDAFNEAAHATAASNLIRAFVRASIEEYATVLHGGGSGFTPAAMLKAHLSGVLEALADVDPRCSFRRIVFCEVDDSRLTVMRSTLTEFASHPPVDGVEVIFDELPPPPKRGVPEIAEPRSTRSDLYLTVQERGRDKKEKVLDWHFSILSPHGAGVLSRTKKIREASLDDLLEQAKDVDSAESQAEWGRKLAKLLLPPDIVVGLQETEHRAASWTVIHDTATSRVPWEALVFDAFEPAVDMGLSRRYDGPRASIARWLERRLVDAHLDILVVVPTADLPGARQEAEVVSKLEASDRRIRVKVLEGKEATIEAVKGELSSGKYDVFHYAGHAAFDEQSRRSWLDLANGQLDGTMLATIRSLPMLAVLNACESARIDAPESLESKDVRGLAETLLMGGIGHFVGTHWPVGDKAAELFAAEFYARLLEGRTIGEATRRGRSVVRTAKLRDWANFVHWGPSGAVVKTRKP